LHNDKRKTVKRGRRELRVKRVTKDKVRREGSGYERRRSRRFGYTFMSQRGIGERERRKTIKVKLLKFGFDRIPHVAKETMLMPCSQ